MGRWHHAGMKTSLSLLLTCVALGISPGAFAWTVSGVVVDESGNPIASAVVSVGPDRHAVDRSGRFVIDVDEELAVLDIRAEGYYGFMHTLHRSDAETAKNDFRVELVARQEDRRLLLFAGDAMLARRYFEPLPGEPVLVRKGHVLEDGKKLLEVIRPYVQLADYASVNVETQMSSTELTQRLPKSFTFYSPPELAEVLAWAGFDYAALGNNHTWDYQEQGLTPTLAALDAAGFDYSGAGLDEAAARKAQSVEIGNQPYRFLSYVGWAGLFSPTQAAAGDKGGAALGNSEVFAEDLAPIDPGTVAVIQYHSGIEYSEMPAMSERMRLREAIDFGADIAIGHHPHVLHGFEIYENRLIAYSMGNFLFDQFDYATQMAMLVYVWMDGDELHRAEVVPVNVNGYVPTPATGEFRSAILNRLARTSRPLGTCPRPNGAHVVIERCAAGTGPQAQLADIGGSRAASVPLHLETLGLSVLDPVTLKTDGPRYRLGLDILPRGDFESEGLFGTSDRAFLRGKNSRFVDADSRALRIEAPAGETVQAGQRVFERVYTVSNPTTVSGRVKTSSDVTVEVLLQRRRTDESLSEALRNDTARVVGRFQVPAGGWKTFAVDFDQPRVSTRAVRVLLNMRAEAGDAEVLLDDLDWVEWRTPWLDGSSQPDDPVFATHVQFQPK
jgi:poly-gamma-glutamate capsule biosynthesis protein CapA/YwtB (metallophosphatase superfamily)